jgi:hypothetical protein
MSTSGDLDRSGGSFREQKIIKNHSKIILIRQIGLEKRGNVGAPERDVQAVRVS